MVPSLRLRHILANGSVCTEEITLRLGCSQLSELTHELKERVESVQTWFFDLDDTHAPSPAKIIAKKAVGTSHFNPSYIKWALTQGLPAKLSKSRESKAWKMYVNNFLRSEKAIEEVKGLFTPEKVRDSLYPGVLDFCELVSQRAPAFYITRNIAEVAAVYTKAVGIDHFFAEVEKKGRVVYDFLRQHPEVKVVGIEGDSEEDAVMIGAAKELGREVVSFYSVNKLTEVPDPFFDYSVLKDRRGLVELLRNK